MLSFKSRILNVVVILYIVYNIYDIFEMPKNNAPQIDGRLSETEIKIKKIKKEMRDRKSQGRNPDGGLTILLKEKIQNILNEQFVKRV